jgi:hypothetical protein
MASEDPFFEWERERSGQRERVKLRAGPSFGKTLVAMLIIATVSGLLITGTIRAESIGDFARWWPW